MGGISSLVERLLAGMKPIFRFAVKEPNVEAMGFRP
jgi:hypothetical protein